MLFLEVINDLQVDVMIRTDKGKIGLHILDFLLKRDRLVGLYRTDMPFQIVGKIIQTFYSYPLILPYERAHNAEGVVDKMWLYLGSQEFQRVLFDAQLFFRNAPAHLLLIDRGQVDIVCQYRESRYRLNKAGLHVAYFENGGNAASTLYFRSGTIIVSSKKITQGRAIYRNMASTVSAV